MSITLWCLSYLSIVVILWSVAEIVSFNNIWETKLPMAPPLGFVIIFFPLTIFLGILFFSFVIFIVSPIGLYHKIIISGLKNKYEKYQWDKKNMLALKGKA